MKQGIGLLELHNGNSVRYFFPVNILVTVICVTEKSQIILIYLEKRDIHLTSQTRITSIRTRNQQNVCINLQSNPTFY